MFLPLLIVLSAIYLIVFISLSDMEEYTLVQTEAMLTEKYRQELKTATEIGVSLVKSIYEDQNLTEEEKFDLSASLVRKLRFGTDGYYFAYEKGTGINKIHGVKQQLEGVNLWEFQDPNDPQFMIQELDRVANDQTLFHEYYWTKQDTQTTHPKLGTAQLIPGTTMWIGTGAYIDDIEADLQGIHASIAQMIGERLNFFLMGFIILIVLTLILIFLLSRSFTKPIYRAIEFAKAMANGDMSATLELKYNGKNEMGQLIGALNQMKSNFTEMINKLYQASANLLKSSDKITSFTLSLNQYSDNLFRDLAGIEKNVVSYGHSVNQTKQSSDEITTFINNLSKLIVNQASALTESTTSIGQMTSNIQNIAQSTDEKFTLTKELEGRALKGISEMQVTTGVINEVAASANVMMDMIAVINNITAQTNLLAMNASIEAAHAGEAGKGFAVVASEILKLAKDTSENAKLISESLKNTIALISNSKESITNTELLFNNIVEGIKGMAISMTEMKNHVQEVATGSTQITYALGEIMNITEDVKGSSTTTMDKIETINGMMEKLFDDFSETSKGIQLIVGSTDNLSKHIANGQTVGKDNSDIVSNLNSIVELFDIGTDSKS